MLNERPGEDVEAPQRDVDPPNAVTQRRGALPLPACRQRPRLITGGSTQIVLYLVITTYPLALSRSGPTGWPEAST